MSQIADKTKKFYDLLHKEVVPAVGCTEPIALALCVAKAREVLGEMPDKIEILCSLNIYKNGMGVGIPGTSITGLPIAAALGAIAGRADKELEVLSGVKAFHEEAAKTFLANEGVSIAIKENCDKLYVEAICTKGQNKSCSIIQGSHKNFVYITHNEEVLLDVRIPTKEEQEGPKMYDLTIDDIYDFALNEPLDKIRFILEYAMINKRLADYGIANKSGMGIGANLLDWINKNKLHQDYSNYAMALTAAASDARMSGCLLPAMSNSGSGNQGITAMVPVLAIAEKIGASNEKLIRALILSNLTVIHIKQGFGRLSAACGCVVASTGAACGVCYLLGGNREQIKYSIKNMIGNLAGMVCDGAKLGCALKVASGTSAAIQSAILALHNVYVPDNNGIIEKDIENSIRNLGLIANKAMVEADRVILDIMTHKSK
ncbi:MAG: L-serine ammonia-lyase, iron-sulfur-dependent, subunit alpha [Bacteroidales bacterium]